MKVGYIYCFTLLISKINYSNIQVFKFKMYSEFGPNIVDIRLKAAKKDVSQKYLQVKIK